MRKVFLNSTSDGKVDAAREVSEPRPTRQSAKKDQERMVQWANILSPPENIIDIYLLPYELAS